MKDKDYDACKKESESLNVEDNHFFFHRCENHFSDNYQGLQGEKFSDLRTKVITTDPPEVLKFCDRLSFWAKSVFTSQTVAVKKTIPFDRVIRVDIERIDNKGRYGDWETICGYIPNFDQLWHGKHKLKSMKITTSCRREFAQLGYFHNKQSLIAKMTIMTKMTA